MSVRSRRIPATPLTLLPYQGVLSSTLSLVSAERQEHMEAHNQTPAYSGSFDYAQDDKSLLPPVLILISKIIRRIPHNHFVFAGLQLSPEFSRRSHPQGPGLNHRLLGNQRTRRNDRSRTDPRTVQNDRSHADQAPVFDHAAMQRD